MSRDKRAVVLGILGRTPFAGVTWQVLHYLEGLRRLGWDVHYVEDTGDWPYDAERQEVSADCGFTLRYIARCMERCGMAERWAYRAASQGDEVLGPAASRFAQIFEEAAVLLNVTGSTPLREEHAKTPVRVYVESDPGMPQIEVAKKNQYTLDALASHTHHFTFGERYGEKDGRLPIGPFDYQPTRQPVVLDWWSATGSPADAARFTTVASWHQSGKDIEWNGEMYTWSKDVQFADYFDFPSRTPMPLEMALAGCPERSMRELESHGWRIVDAIGLSTDPEPYRNYIRDARGEFGVSKDQYTRLRTGWFSDRSACFLAAGRPVVAQETGFSRVLPCGRGLFAFDGPDDAAAALAEIESDYGLHCRAAEEIAREFFDAEKVVASLLERSGL
jgi:hypothetical protein